MRPRAGPAVVLAMALVGGPQPQPDPGFRAATILERQQPGSLPRVRFEWPARPNVVEYLLTGSWAVPGSWAIHRGEFRVSRRTASSWSATWVTYEVSLPLGDHSWRLASVNPSGGAPDARATAQLGFQLR